MIEEITKEAFHAVQGVSYSKLSKLADGPQAYRLSLEQPATGSGLDLGSVVDKLLTGPETFLDEFYVMTADKPESEMMIAFVETLVSTGNREEAWRRSGYKIGLEQVFGKFQKEGKAYFDALILGKDKKIIDVEMAMKANQIVSELKSNLFTKNYFIAENNNVEIRFQFNMIWDINVQDLTVEVEHPEYNVFITHLIPLKAKGIIDILKIDHEQKLINIIDIKTGAEGFWKSFWRFKYYLQGSMYYYGTIATLSKEYPDYWIMPTKFIYVDTNLFYPPRIYSMTGNDVICGKHGYYAKSPSNNNEIKLKYKGYEQLAAELMWHQKMDRWDYPYEVYMTEGEVEIDAFSIKL